MRGMNLSLTSLRLTDRISICFHLFTDGFLEFCDGCRFPGSPKKLFGGFRSRLWDASSKSVLRLMTAFAEPCVAEICFIYCIYLHFKQIESINQRYRALTGKFVAVYI